MSSDIISTAAGRNQPVIAARAGTVRPHLGQTFMRPRSPTTAMSHPLFVANSRPTGRETAWSG
ncbi:hypothetical protein M0657_001307 [Pyricularia oryzae]|uniref:Uncharacterized protein n=1 Tax=Pyricularia oryzae TaxID=318829 RepID=A0A4P7NNI6_PYROR|nr:hypothetical protein M9X92_007139 [Pyricularia oryzae]KAI7931353.1 hypothetical protein M0657_001307 [Pyricularia oryzae]QBZ63864.1 hypothetical protein PoMZ_05555 [Pyricularia oryzae]